MIPLIAGLALSASAACTSRVALHPDEGAAHITACGRAEYGTNPPSSGAHYGSWARYRTYPAPVPAGFLVHSLEHGAVVIGYRCPEGCPEEVARVQAWIESLPGDSLCDGGRPKVILAPDPSLDDRWAAAAWTATWKAPCPDTASLGAFYRAHYGRTMEAGVCGGGVDYSAAGWCPDVAVREGKVRDPAPLWSGALPARTRLLLELIAADGTLLGAWDLGEAGPGHAEASSPALEPAVLRARRGAGGPAFLRLKTASGRELARRRMFP